MKATFISKEQNNAKFSMEFTAEEFEAAIIKAYQAAKHKFTIDGFRKGKAPRSIIQRHYGEGVFFEDAVDNLFSETYPEAISQLSLDVIDRPHAEFTELKEGQGFTITITAMVYPEIEVKDYQGVEVKQENSDVTGEDVEKELETLQKRNSRMVLVERPIQDGDTVLIDYEGRIGDTPFEGGAAERQPLKIGSGTFIPGFEEQLIGLQAGEEKEVTVTFPDEYQAEELAGKEAVFQCKIHEIKEEELPVLDDDFAKDVSEYDTLEDLKGATEVRLKEAAEAAAENKMRDAMLEKVYNANDIEVPDVLVEEEISSMMQEFDQQLRAQGMNLEQYFQYLQRDPKDFRKELRDDAFKKVKTRMIVGAVADAEHIQATEEDIEEEITSMAERYKMEADKIRDVVETQNGDMIKNDIKIRKAVEWMFEKAAIQP